MAENSLDIFENMKNAGLKDSKKSKKETADKEANNSTKNKNASSNSKTPKKPVRKPTTNKTTTKGSGEKKEELVKASVEDKPIMNKPVVETKVEEAKVVEESEVSEVTTPTVEKKTEPVEVKKNTTLTMLITEEQSEFLYEYHIKEGLFKKDAFEKIIMNEINNGSPDELAKEFRKIRHNNVKESLAISKELVDTIKESAKTYMLKTSAFVSYCLEKAMRESKKDK